MSSVFEWRGVPSSISFQRAPNKHKGSPPPLLNGSARNGTASIASAEKTKRKPGAGTSATS